MSDTSGNGNARRARAVVLWAFTAVLAGQALATGAFLAMHAANRRAEAEQQCWARVANHAAALRDERDTAQSQALVYRVAGRDVDVAAAADHLDDLNHRLTEASALRTRAIGTCAANPDFNP